MRRRPADLVVILPFSFLVLAAWLGALFLESPWAPWLDNLHWTLASAGAALLTWRTVRTSVPGTAGHRLRWGSFLALAIYGVGQLFWDLEAALGWSLFPGVSDLFHLCLGPVVSVALVSSWTMRPGARKIPGIQLDSTLMTLGIVLLCMASYLPHQAEWTWFQLAVMVAYPSTLFGAFSVGLVLVLHDPSRFHLGKIVTLAALFGLSFSWMGWNLAVLSGTASDGSLLSLSFSVFILSLGASIGRWSWSRQTARRGWKAGVLVLLPLVGPVFGALGFLIVVTDPTAPASSRLVFGLFTLLLLVLSLFRQWTLFRELEDAQSQRERNTRLEDALAELHKTQEQLVQSAKLTALGQLIAGITHDLNSPLGAIRSSSTLLQTVLQEQNRASVQLVEALGPDERLLYRKLGEALTPDLPFLDSRSERQLRKQLEEAASAHGHRRPEALASALADTGLAGRADLVAEVLALPDPEALLKALEPQATAHRLASVIHQATERASQVVVSLHNFLRSGDEGGKRWVVVADSIRELLPLFQHRMKQGLELSTSFEGDAVVLAWPDKLSQVWVNLLTNAVQAVGSSGVIEVTEKVDQGHAVVTVTDNGPGVPPEMKDRIFDAFFTTKGAGEGTGLGLEVCRRVILEHGGTITLASQPGRTVFEVRLPLARELV